MRQLDYRHHFRDKVLHCCDCRQSFVFTAGEQAYFQSKGLSAPKRCKSCRELRKRTLIPDMEERSG
ncbi:MAG: zinc-ribbon domain-containing protein [Dehalococcoidia bacterium]|nr:zinc-ribbon domain-containing protein [Dehalococcoidia bacterium]